LISEFAAIRKACWGRHVWARGFFVASSGSVTDDVVREYIENTETGGNGRATPGIFILTPDSCILTTDVKH